MLRRPIQKFAVRLFVVLSPGLGVPGLAMQTATRPVVSAPPAAAAPAAQSATAPQTGTSPAQVSADYVIGPNDSLDIEVWKEPQVSGKLPVRPDGMISLPLVGDMPAAGFTPMQLGQEVGTRLKKFINEPAVTVTVLAVNSKQIYLLGEVAKVGPLPMTPGMTPLQAIATAGGLTPYANAKHIYILRTVAGKQQKVPFDYKKALKDGNMQGVTLISGDTIVVP